MLQMHSIKSSFEAVSFVGIGLLAQLGPLVYQGVSFMNAAPTVASDHLLISQKFAPTRTTPLAPTKTSAVPTGGTPVLDAQFVLCTAAVLIVVHYGKRFLRGRGRPPPGGPPRRPSDRTTPGRGSPGPGPPTPPPDAGAASDSIPPPKKRGWLWTLIIFIVSILLNVLPIWYFWPEIVRFMVLSIVVTLSSFLLVFAGSIALMGVAIRRKVRKYLTKVKKRLSDHFGHWSTQYPRTTDIAINLLLVLWGGLCLLSPVVVGTLAFHGLFKHSPEFQQLVFDWNTSVCGLSASWFIDQLTLDDVMYIVGPTALLVLYKLCSTYPEEYMDALSDIAAELIQKNHVVMERLRALQARVPGRPEAPTTQQDHGVHTNGEDTKATPGDGASRVPLESHPETPTSQQDLEVRTDGEDTKATANDGTPKEPFESHPEAPTNQQDREDRTDGEDIKAAPGGGASMILLENHLKTPTNQQDRGVRSNNSEDTKTTPSDGAPPEAPIDHGKLERPTNRSIPQGLAVIPMRRLRMEKRLMEGKREPVDALA